jgi:hypothetical protein
MVRDELLNSAKIFLCPQRFDDMFDLVEILKLGV